MRRSLVAAFAVLFGFTLAAAAPAPSVLGTPVLVVFPFAANGGDITKEAGSELAVTIATQIANLGGVDVKPATPGVERKDFLVDAHRSGADYYIAGYMTPLGNGVSVVEQLVSTQTGIVVYSNSAQIRTYADAAGQGDILREALLRHQQRNLEAYAAPPPPVAAAPGTPAPGAAYQANISGLFGHHQKRASAAPASATPAPPQTAAVALASPVATSRTVPAATAAPAIVAAAHGAGYGILAVSGTASDDRRNFAGAALRNALAAKHKYVETARTAQAGCGSGGIDTLVGASLATRSHTLLGEQQTLATLELVAYDCAGHVVYRETFAHDARGDWKYAVDDVVNGAVAALLRQPAGARHS